MASTQNSADLSPYLVHSGARQQGSMISRPEAFSWLCPTAGHRARFRDMQQRVRTGRVVTVVCGVGLMAALFPRAGWPVLVVGTVMLAIVLVGGTRLDRRRRPELWVFASTVLNVQIAITLAVVVTGGPRTALSSMLAAPVLMVGARFSNRGLIVGAPISAALVLVSTIGVDPAYVWHHPYSVIVPLALVIITAAYLSPLVASDVRHRTSSTLDALTGALNVRALEARLAEVSEQAAANGWPVSLVALDIDHFKMINDAHGHGAGDLALRQVAGALNHTLRTFELLYRVGGDEFLLLLPGGSTEDAVRVAETLRRAVTELRPRGVPLTCSFGVATAHGVIDAATLTAATDDALYSAKRCGGNRVERHNPTALRPLPQYQRQRHEGAAVEP
jgi:diguanylate cyclase (GGDEF)-like protein